MPLFVALRASPIAQRQSRLFTRTMARHSFREHLGTSEMADSYPFGDFRIAKENVFFWSPRSIAFVNLKPILSGHVLVTPRAVKKRFRDLDADEVADLWQSVQKVAMLMERHHGAEAMTMAIQDGEAAGMTVAHCHVHIIPRHRGDFSKNDEIYDALDNANIGQAAREAQSPSSQSSTQMSQQHHHHGVAPDPQPEQQTRRTRTREEMAAEAAELREVVRRAAEHPEAFG